MFGTRSTSSGESEFAVTELSQCQNPIAASDARRLPMPVVLDRSSRSTTRHGDAPVARPERQEFLRPSRSALLRQTIVTWEPFWLRIAQPLTDRQLRSGF